ncbi:MAG TPA: hypothetical protein VMU84_00300 [Thermoanaerobaculia bacterium]|nr:hypothetical protein [Thermoanaerobaculia bacterium]
MGNRFPTIALALVAFSALLSPMQRELFVGDETKYSQVVREMRAGSFFLPTLEGSPFTHKPPLHFWIVDLLTHPFGTYSIWPFVIPSLIAFALLLWLMRRMGGALAAFVCGTSLLVWGSAQTARMDVEFTALIALAAWMLQRFFDRDEGGPDTLVWAAIALGIATVIKGPMAPVIGIVLFVFECIRRRRLPRSNYFPAIATLIAIPLLWLVPALIVGGDAFAREILIKQTVNRAVGSWVHKSPPWFYVQHAPGFLFPWFFLLIVALIAAYRRRDAIAKFHVSWILAVLVPYSLLSSKLDVYMMAMIPPVSLVIARLLAADDPLLRWGHRVNQLLLAILAAIGVAGLFIDRPYVSLPLVKGFLGVLAAGAIVSLFIARRVIASTYAVGLTLIAAFSYAAIALVPLANEMASPRPLIRAIVAQRVPPEDVALYSCPHLWSRTMPRELERVRYVGPDDLRGIQPTLIVTSRKHAHEIAYALAGYRKVAEFQMIEKPFDVYRR